MSEFELDLDSLNTPEEAPEKVGIVDADSIIFQLGWYYEKADLLPKDGVEYRDAVSAPDFVHTAVETYLNKMRKEMGVDMLHLHFTGSAKNQELFEEFSGRPMQTQFRQTLGNTYKANRPSGLPTGYHYTLRSLLQEGRPEMGSSPKAISYIHDQWEADEAVLLHKKLNPEWILSSCDKDVYKQHVGTNWIYDKRKKWENIDKDFANYFAFLQAITGDAVDGFIGAKGIGEKGAMKFVSPNKTPAENWQGVLDAFHSKGFGEREALMNMRFANMHQLRLGDDGAPYVDLWKPEGSHLDPAWK